MCGDDQVGEMRFECHISSSYSDVLSIEVGIRSPGGGNLPIARILNDKIYTMNVVDAAYAHRFNQTNFGRGRLAASLWNPRTPDMHTYYCSAAYIDRSLVYSEAQIVVQAKTLKGNTLDCSALQVNAAVARQQILAHPNAGTCPDGKDDRPEALVLSYCRVPDVSLWIPGPKIVDFCCQIPAYTPIATFVFNVYVQDEHGVSAVFLACTHDGFKMAIQLCGHPPMVVSLTRSSAHGFVENADNYHVLLHHTQHVIG